MQKRRLLIIFAGICLLLILAVVLPYVITYNSLHETKENHTLIIRNQDNTSHELTVKLFDLNNSSIFNESYVLDPEEKIKSQYPVRLITGTYIEVTLDNNITKAETVYSNLSDTDILYINIDARSDNLLALSIVTP
ncbi:hypothetical protein [Methanosarcina siciliae]|uniref:hypothetical protein n=1 Tax=Methanosarcina siciliae TaxID=38027 RepID=UPI000B2DE9A3|nr:hypothetical protein [Methanosarcina siciliae]